MRRIAFVAPLPPPVHGFSNICAAMLDILRAKSEVRVFDRAPRGGKHFGAALRQLIKPWRYLAWCMKNPGGELYLALSGGLGQILDWPYVLMARLFGQQVFVHHHSFAYINAPSVLNRMFFKVLRQQTHIVLSDRMGSELTRIYRLNAAKVRVVSNAAFFGEVARLTRSLPKAEVPIRLGYLSNISLEKGVVEFFAVLAELTRIGIEFRAQIAGPVDSAAQSTFDRLLAAAVCTQYVGPVYGPAKEDFYGNLDVLLFPSDYANEAEPLVIHEAIRNGVHVIACERGAVADILSNQAGVVAVKAAFVHTAVSHIGNFSSNRHELQRAQRSSLDQAARMREGAREKLESLVDEISGSVKRSLQTC